MQKPYLELEIPSYQPGPINKIFFLDAPAPGKRSACDVLPDGCIDLTFEITNREVTPYLFGSSTQKYSFQTTIDAKYFGIRFRPGFMPLLDDYKPSDLINSHVQLAHLHLLKSEAEFLGENSSWESKILWSHDFVQRFVRFSENPRIKDLLTYFRQEEGVFDLEETIEKTGYSIRQTQRYFQESIGLGPKMLSRILRMQKALRLLKSSSSLAGVAVECGYYDQSHMTNDFKKFLGKTPAHYFFS